MHDDTLLEKRVFRCDECRESVRKPLVIDDNKLLILLSWHYGSQLQSIKGKR